MQTKILELIDSMYNNLRDKVINGGCTDAEINKALVTLHPSTNKEYFKASDYCNYDEACKILHISVTNRAKLKGLCDQYGVKCVYVKNRPLGFPRVEIERIAEILDAEWKQNDNKLRKKKGAVRKLW